MRTPVERAWARIAFLQASINWQHSMYSELFDGVVTFSTDDYIAAMWSSPNVTA